MTLKIPTIFTLTPEHRFWNILQETDYFATSTYSPNTFGWLSSWLIVSNSFICTSTVTQSSFEMSTSRRRLPLVRTSVSRRHLTLFQWEYIKFRTSKRLFRGNCPTILTRPCHSLFDGFCWWRWEYRRLWFPVSWRPGPVRQSQSLRRGNKGRLAWGAFRRFLWFETHAWKLTPVFCRSLHGI